MSPDFWIMLTAILAAGSCGLIGTFLVLRQNAMLGDAISHSVLPGLVIAFIITSSNAVLPMLIGATVMGLLTAYLTELLSRSGLLYKDASIGIVFTFLFSVGVILVSVYAGDVHIDQDCVLYGEIAYTPWDRFIYDSIDLGPRSVWILGGVFLANIIFIVSFFKQLKISSFDSEFAESIGISTQKWHYLLMTMVALTVVASFEAVGAILVVAMLIIPGAVAYLLTDNLIKMLILAVIVGILSAVGGFQGAMIFESSISGFMAVFGGIIFGITLFYRIISDKFQTQPSKLS